MGKSSENTDTAATRWTYTNDVLSTILVVSFVAYLFVPILLELDTYPETNPVVLGGFVTGFGIAVAWSFGSEAVKAWQEDNGGE